MVARASLDRRRWVVIGLAVYAGIVGLVVFTPISYSAVVNAIGAWLATHLGLDWFGSGWIEFCANILMFVPLGFLLTLLLRRSWVGVGLAVVLSAGVEVAQVVIPQREPTPRDVLANTLGAIVGAVVAGLLVLRRRHRDRRAAVAASDDTAA